MKISSLIVLMIPLSLLTILYIPRNQPQCFYRQMCVNLALLFGELRLLGYDPMKMCSIGAHRRLLHAAIPAGRKVWFCHRTLAAFRNTGR